MNKRCANSQIQSQEKYSRGWRGAPAKGVGRETGARVQIPLSPLSVILKTTGCPVVLRILKCHIWRCKENTVYSTEGNKRTWKKLWKNCKKTVDKDKTKWYYWWADSLRESLKKENKKYLKKFLTSRKAYDKI